MILFFTSCVRHIPLPTLSWVTHIKPTLSTSSSRRGSALVLVKKYIFMVQIFFPRKSSVLRYMEHCKHIIRGMKEIRLFRLREWILQCIERLLQSFQCLQVPYSQKNFSLPSVLQCPGKTDNPASSAEIQKQKIRKFQQKSPCRWNDAKPQFCHSSL